MLQRTLGGGEGCHRGGGGGGGACRAGGRMQSVENRARRRKRANCGGGADIVAFQQFSPCNVSPLSDPPKLPLSFLRGDAAGLLRCASERLKETALDNSSSNNSLDQAVVATTTTTAADSPTDASYHQHATKASGCCACSCSPHHLDQSEYVAARRGLYDLVDSLMVVNKSQAGDVNTFEVAARLVEVGRISATSIYGVQSLYVRSCEEEEGMEGLRNRRKPQKKALNNEQSWKKLSSEWEHEETGDSGSTSGRSSGVGSEGGASSPSKRAKHIEEQNRRAGGSSSADDEEEYASDFISVFEPKGTVGIRFRQLFTWIVGSLFTTKYFKAFILLLFVAYVAVSAYGISILTVGMEMEALFPPGSYIRSSYEVIRSRYPAFGASAVVFFPEQHDWWTPRVQEELIRLDDELLQKWYVRASLNGMRAYLAQPEATPQNRPEFIADLQAWLKTSVGGIFADDFKWTDSEEGTPELASWRIRLLTPLFDTAAQTVDFMVDIRNLTANSHIQPMPYCRSFRFSETDLVILSQTIQGMLAAFAAVVVVSLVVLRTAWSTVLVSLIIFLVDLGLLGFMPLVGLELNMVTMVTLIMSIGFSVDYTLHVVHTFTDCVGPTRRNRMIETMILMGVAVTNGCVSTFLGILPLCWRLDEYMHQLFFKMVALILLFGISHGLLLLPVLLSIFGPISDARDHPHPPVHPHLHCQELSISLFQKAATVKHLYQTHSKHKHADVLRQPEGDSASSLPPVLDTC
eukprot:GHVS01038290.1.p1 GENE.GHVS01038290.1~~GHVS01038290.1.p1  ORF type:complete len:747 (+),score=129.63 GHVS01038290.1:29-2269(+)